MSQVITGTEDDWKSTAGTSWGTASNWSLGAVPGSTNTAVFTSTSAASGTVTLSGSSVVGIVWLSGASSYTLTDSSGPQITLTLGADGLQNYSSNAQTITGSRVNIILGTSSFFDVGSSGNLTISATGSNAPLNLGANTLTVKGSSTGTGTISSVISGTGNIVKSGTGTWILSGANTYSGTTTVNGGILKLGISSALPSTTALTVSGTGAGTTATLDLNTFNTTVASLTLGGSTTTSGAAITTNGGTLTLGGNVTYDATNNPLGATISGNLSLGTATRTFTIGNSSSAAVDLAVAAIVSGSVGLIKAGAGVLSLSGANSYSAGTTINGGTIVVNSSSNLGSISGGLTINAGTLEVATGFSTVRTITLGNAASTFQIDPSQTYTVTSAIGGSGALNKTGTGTMVLSGSNTFIGGTNVTAGTLRIGASERLADLGALTVSGGTFDLQTFNETVGVVTLSSGSIIGSGSATLTGSSYAAQSGTISAILGGTAALTKTTSGTVTLSGTNTYTGGTAINGGTLYVTGSGALGSAGTISFGGGSLEYSATNITDYSSRFSSAINQAYNIDTNGQNVTFASPLTSLGGSLAKLGSGTLILSGVNTYTGGTTVSAGTLQMSAVNRLLNTGALTISGGTFDLQTFGQAVGAVTLTSGSITGSGILTGSSYSVENGSISAIVGGAGALTKSTSSTVTLSGSNLYTGSTTISAGTLQVNSNNALGMVLNGTTVSNGAALKLNSVNYSTAEALTLNGTGISGGGALTNSGTSTFAGAINVATNSTISASGGTLNLTGGISKNGTTLTFSGGGTVNIMSHGITGSSPNSDLVVDGTTVVLDTANSYNGPTTVQNSGILKLGANNVLPSSPQTALTVNTSSVFDMASYSDGVASLTGDGTATVKNSVASTTSTFTVNPDTGVSTTFAGVIAGTNGGAQGNIALLKTGAGSLALTGANTFSGSTTISGGTMTAAATSGSALGSTSSITVNSGGTLALGASNQINNSASIILAGGMLVKGNFSEGSTNAQGAGALTLTAGGSRIDFGTGTVGVICFDTFTPGANTLAIDNWTGTANTVGSSSTDRLVFGSDQSGNLSNFWFSGYAPGASEFSLGGGYYEIAPTVVPEPSTWAGATLGMVMLALQPARRRRCRRDR